MTEWSCDNTTVRTLAGTDALMWTGEATRRHRARILTTCMTGTTCQTKTPYWDSGPLRFNIVRADLGQPNIKATAMIANQSGRCAARSRLTCSRSVPYGLQPLDEIAAQNPRVVVGINGVRRAAGLMR